MKLLSKKAKTNVIETKTPKSVNHVLADHVIRQKAEDIYRRDGIEDANRNWFKAIEELS